MDDLTGGESWVNPLRDGTSPQSENQKKKKEPLHWSFISYRPSAGAAPRSVIAQQQPWPADRVDYTLDLTPSTLLASQGMARLCVQFVYSG